MTIPESTFLQFFMQKSPEERQAILFILRRLLAVKALRRRLVQREKPAKKV